MKLGYKLKNLRRFAKATSAIGLAVAALPGMAQQAADAGMEHVIVTAQKRAQEAQDIPISLYSASGGSLERSGIVTVQDLGSAVAGVSIGAFYPGSLQVNIRGVTDLNSLVAGTPANGFYLDEVPISATGGHQPELGLWDVERVEVLRGPQGTLFGEGSMGGTVRVITKKPDSTEFFGRVAVGGSQTSGGGSGYSAKASLNLPISKDVAAISIGVSDQKFPGWIDIPSLLLKDANTTTLKDGRVALRAKPSKEFTIDASYTKSKIDTGEFGATSPGVLDPKSANPRAGNPGWATSRNSDLDIAGVTLSYDFGSATLVSATTSFKGKTPFNRELDSVAPLFFGTVSHASIDGWDDISATTQELRLVSNGHKQFDWTVGAYYKDDKRTRRENWHFNIPGWGLTENSSDEDRSTAKSSAVFGEADYALTDKVSVQAGLRYYRESVSVNGVQISPTMIFGKPAGSNASSHDATATSPKLAVNWKLGKDVMVFGKVSKGFRGGAANSNASGSSKYPEMSSGYAPETLTAYEAGVKTSPAAGWFLNGYLYENKWKDLQLGFVTHDGLLAFTANAGSATAKGAELELGGRVSQNLSLGANLSYVDAKIDTTVLNAVGGVAAKAGNAIPLAAKTKVALTADYSFPLSASLKGNINGRYTMASSNFSEATNDQALKNEATSQLFLRAGVSSPKWGSLSVYGDNLSNRNDTSFRQRQVGVGLVYQTYLRPRTVGVEYKTDF